MFDISKWCTQYVCISGWWYQMIHFGYFTCSFYLALRNWFCEWWICSLLEIHQSQFSCKSHTFHQVKVWEWIPGWTKWNFCLHRVCMYVPFHIQAFEHKWEVGYSTSKFSSEIPHAILKIVFCLYCIYIFTVVHIQLSTHGFGLHKWIEIVYKSLTLHNISIALIYWLLPYTISLLRQAVKLLCCHGKIQLQL